MGNQKQTPEQRARDEIDRQLLACGWIIQDKNRIDLKSSLGVAVREFQTDSGICDYVLFVAGKPAGVIEAKREDEGMKLSVHDLQAERYGAARIKYLNNEKLPFVYVSTGAVTRIINFLDPKPKAREVFSFYRPESIQTWMRKSISLRQSLKNLGKLDKTGLRECQVKAISNLEEALKKSGRKNNRSKENAVSCMR